VRGAVLEVAELPELVERYEVWLERQRYCSPARACCGDWSARCATAPPSAATGLIASGVTAPERDGLLTLLRAAEGQERDRP
jgi:hypothetical protein